MKNPKILSIQDISCYGQCSLTVALPILSSLGVETAILPTAILSTHTAGFQGFTFRDLKDDLPAIAAHWKKEGIRFDAIYTGYLGNEDDVRLVVDIAESELNQGPIIVDPAFGDQGKLYGLFDENYVRAMRELAKCSDLLLPNLTEAAFLLGRPYNPNPDEEEIQALLQGLLDLGAKAVLLKGIGDDSSTTGFVLAQEGKVLRYSHQRINQDFHGTGDVFASSFVGGLVRGLNAYDAGVLAADFTLSCISNTIDDPEHRYGVKFEPLLYGLEQRLRIALGQKR